MHSVSAGSAIIAAEIFCHLSRVASHARTIFRPFGVAKSRALCKCRSRLTDYDVDVAGAELIKRGTVTLPAGANMPGRLVKLDHAGEAGATRIIHAMSPCPMDVAACKRSALLLFLSKGGPNGQGGSREHPSRARRGGRIGRRAQPRGDACLVSRVLRPRSGPSPLARAIA